jgi:L,D-peptidoglycan transpeptidase YkuD (ErfK/YbiS/YcfS/YnhG family)
VPQHWKVGALGEINRGRLEAAGRVFDVSLGRNGIRTDKREGDGATPAGIFKLQHLLWRADRLARPKTRLPTNPILARMGWCDDPADFRYNRPVSLPWPASAECLWRQDHLYDLVLVTSHNQNPVVPGAGSAVFIHLQREDKGPTAGCIALQRLDLLEFLEHAGPETEIHIG